MPINQEDLKWKASKLNITWFLYPVAQEHFGKNSFKYKTEQN